MGNRAVITTCKDADVENSNALGVYVHWNGGRDSVEAFLLYCSLKGYRPPDEDCYGFARLCQVIGNYFGGVHSLGIDTCKRLDCDNCDNGVYVIEDWQIVDRKYFEGEEQNSHQLFEMLADIDDAQPSSERIGHAKLKAAANEFAKKKEEGSA